MQNINPMMVCKPVKFNTLAFSRDTAAYRYDSDGILDLVAADVIREGYDPTTLDAIGPIIEGEATNLFTYSNDFENAAWTKALLATVDDAPAEINPAGVAGCKLYNGDGWITRSNPFSVGQNCTISIYAKSADAGGMEIIGVGPGPCFFNLASGTAYGSADAKIQALPNGWYRCYVSGVSYATSIRIQGIIPGSGIPPEILLYGAQIEAGLSMSSLIDTEATIETRAADVYGQSPTVISSNIAESDYPDYDPETIYAIGAKVMVRGDYHRNYQSTADTNEGNFPPDSTGGLTPKWIDIGATNRWRMFDYKVGVDLPSTAPNPILVTVAVEDPVSSITLLGVVGAMAYVSMRNMAGELIYSKAIELLGDPAEAQWFDYLFGERQIIKNITLTDMPENESVTVSIEIAGASGSDPTELAKLIVGKGIVLGYTEYGSTIGIVDYSTKESDLYGNYYVQERAFVGKADLKIVVSPGYETFVRDTLADLRATPAVYIGHGDYEATIIYGFYKDFSILFSTPADSFCSMTIEGI